MTRVSVIAYNFVLMCTNNVKIKNLELHHRFEHDLRQNELGSVLAVDVANDLPAVEALLLQRNTRTSRLGALPQNRFTIRYYRPMSRDVSKTRGPRTRTRTKTSTPAYVTYKHPCQTHIKTVA